MGSVTCARLHTTEERLAARHIVRRLYQAQGYAASNGDGDSAAFSDSASTLLWGMAYDGTLFGTVSLMVDSASGLPMDSIYAEELLPLRTTGAKIAEVGQFAVDRELYKVLSGKDAPFVAAPLFTAVLRHAIENGVHYLCITVNPKHDAFYAAIGFRQIGGLKHHPSVQAPAIARVFFVPEWKRTPLASAVQQ